MARMMLGGSMDYWRRNAICRAKRTGRPVARGSKSDEVLPRTEVGGRRRRCAARPRGSSVPTFKCVWHVSLKDDYHPAAAAGASRNLLAHEPRQMGHPRYFVCAGRICGSEVPHGTSRGLHYTPICVPSRGDEISRSP